MKAILAMAIVMAGCGGVGHNSKTIAAADYGSDWPFTVEKVGLNCKGKKDLGIVWVGANHKAYPLNGTAKGPRGTAYFAALETDVGDIEEIWRSDTTSHVMDLIYEGLTLCGG